MQIKLAGSTAELSRLAPVLLQLRPSYNLQSLVAQIQHQMNGGYMVAYLESQGEILCVAGFVIVEKLAWGKTLYIDDLVTDERSRSRGCGKHMISWLKTYAIGTGCYQIHLDSGLSRTDTHRFYEREGFNKASYHFSIIDLHN